MASIDLSRDATDFRKHYNGVRMQQGRVLDDQTVNEQARIVEEDMRRTRLNTIGVYGSPDAGFLPKDFTMVSGKPTFTISEGEAYLGGLYLAQETEGAFHLQKDWLNFNPDTDWPAAPADGDSRIDMVYLDVWQQPVSAIEDNELLEVALGGPDTSQRIRTMKRLRISTGVASEECDVAWQAIQADWASQGTIDDKMALATDAKMRVSYTAPSIPADLCSPGTAGGYLYHENQAIRVQLTDASHYTWGFDNAAPLYRAHVTTSEGARVRIQLLNEPKDAVHWPLKDQVVEVIPWSAVLANGQRIAELSGMFAKVAASYNPDDASFLIDTPVPADFGTQWESRSDVNDFFDGSADERFYYIRVWNRGDDLSSPAEIPIANGALGHTGLEVSFVDGPLRRNLFWIIAARTGAPNVVVPWELEAANGALAYGVTVYRAPLALIRWTTSGTNTTGELVHDCRRPYQPLTRIGNCCTCTVGDGTNSYGHYSSIQDAVNHLPASGGKICILAGDYEENVVIDKNHVVIEGCKGRTRLAAKADDPVMTIKASHVHIRDLTVTAHDAGIGIHVPQAEVAPSYLSFNGLALRGATRPALQVDAGRFIDVTGNRVEMQDVASDFHGVFITADDVSIEDNELLVAPPAISMDTGENLMALAGNPGPGTTTVEAGRGGLQIGGTSERVRIVDNLIQGGIGNGITLGTVEDINVDQMYPPLIGWIVDKGDPCDPCSPGSLYIVPNIDNPGAPMYRSRGSLYELTIAGNRIFDFGLNGIGVLAFFNLDQTDEFISVDGITIEGNHIEGCLFRDLAETPDAMLQSMGYGGICLADVDNAVIRENRIVNNGPDFLEPICGIYVLNAEGLEIIGNRIVNNGRKTTESATDAKRGARGGIWVQFTTAPKVIVEAEGRDYPRQNGVPAANVQNNIVSQPLGRSLSMTALGPVVVEANQLTTQAFSFSAHSPSFLVSNVYIRNLGISEEMYLQQILFSGQKFTDLPLSVASDENYIMVSQPGLDSQRLFGYLGNGNVMFSDNQVMLDLTDQTGFKLGFMSIGIVSLDDISFQNNQCDISCDMSLDEIYITQALMLGWTVRCVGNRFKESLFGALFSALTLGIFGNVTSYNECTHCIRAFNFVGGNLVRAPNHVLFDIFNLCKDDQFLQLGGYMRAASANQQQNVLTLLQ